LQRMIGISPISSNPCEIAWTSRSNNRLQQDGA
jgi:hypothetical protein